MNIVLEIVLRRGKEKEINRIETHDKQEIKANKNKNTTLTHSLIFDLSSTCE